MSAALENARREASGWRTYVLAAYYLVAGNVLLSLAAFGVVQIVAGFLLDSLFVSGDGNWAIVSGFLGIWGASLIVLGLGLYGVFWTLRMYSGLAEEPGR